MPESGNSERAAAAGDERHPQAPQSPEIADTGGSAEEDLPEYEPLTPEIVEDDAVRNDFMLRLVVVLLAFLLACTEISETRTLVHVRTGQYIAEHGWLPPRTDVFSYTAADRPWINLSWLFDLFAAGVYGVGGAVGLTIAKAVLAALTFYLVIQAGRSQVSTWWGSICAALAVLVCVPQFTMRPELITLLGVSLVLLILRRWQSNPESKSPWLLVPVILLWSNLDTRAFLGIAMVVLFTIGETVGAWFGRSSLLTSARRNGLAIAAGLCLLAALLNPFGWHAFTAPMALYAGEYAGWRALIGESPQNLSPTLLENYPMTSPVFWKSLNAHTVSGLVLLVAAAVSFVLNRRNVPVAHILLFAGFVGFAVAGTHELASASLVWAVLSTLNAQQWYQQSFRQTYSIDFSERLFSTGGRAVTALALFAVAYLGVSGRLLGRDGPRTGVGFDQPIQAAIDGLHEDLDALRPQDKAFNFLLLQGDLMIWLGRPVFADGRIPLYKLGDEDLIDLHVRLRNALHSTGPSPVSPESVLWRETFNKYDITHAIPWLGSAQPTYGSYFTLVLAPDWQLVRLGPVSAVFCRRDLEELQPYCDEHRVDFARLAFESSSDESPPRPDWARPPSWYQTTLFLPEQERLNDVQLARHFNASLQLLLETGAGAAPAGQQLSAHAFEQNAVALATLAIHYANRGLSRDPGSAAAFFVLGDVYSFLQKLDERYAQPNWNRRRFLQAVAAYRQCLVVAPQGPGGNEIRQRLLDAFLVQGFSDLALEMAREIVEHAPDSESLTADQLSQLEKNRIVLEELQAQAAAVEEEIQRARERQAGAAGEAPPGQVALAAAQYARSRGCVRLALHQLAEVADETLAPNERVQVQLLRGTLLLDAGDAEQAHIELARLEGYVEQFPEQSAALRWRPQAAMAALANGDYPRAIDLWNADLRDYDRAKVNALIDTLPFTSSPAEQFSAQGRELWPVDRAVAGMAVAASQDVLADALLNLAACHLEMRQPERARASLERLLTVTPEASVRPAAADYLSYLADEPVDRLPPSAYIPLGSDIFAPEPDASRD